MGRSTRLWVGALLVVVATGCGRSGAPLGEGVDGDADIPFPEGMPGSDGIPGPVVDAGRGLDGPAVFDVPLTELGGCVVVDSADANGSTVVFRTSVLPFGAGRRVLLAQMNDVLLSNPTSGESMPVTDFGRAGQWEIAEIAAIANEEATLVAPLAGAYTSNLLGLRAQACLVHEWTDVTVKSGATLSPMEWNGETGGILAMQVAGMLFVDGGARLSADESGFRGGKCGTPSVVSNVSDYEVSEGSGGGKGEGLDVRFFSRWGRGSAANAGGGGNGLNAGGGGGGGAGRGGNGGRQRAAALSSAPGNETTHGIPGGAAMNATRLVFGGGGGSGHLDSLDVEVCGGSGGGVLVVRANALGGTGLISANGQNGKQLERNGGGGGGAGGTIDLVTGNATLFMGLVTADGGEGGDVTAPYTQAGTSYGPGGGGGGGHVRAIGLMPSPNVRALGGENGTNENNATVMGAERGADGSVVF